MKKMIGFVALCVAAGMIIMLFLMNRFLGIVLIALLVLVGYGFFVVIECMAGLDGDICEAAGKQSGQA